LSVERPEVFRERTACEVVFILHEPEGKHPLLASLLSTWLMHCPVASEAKILSFSEIVEQEVIFALRHENPLLIWVLFTSAKTNGNADKKNKIARINITLFFIPKIISSSF